MVSRFGTLPLIAYGVLIKDKLVFDDLGLSLGRQDDESIALKKGNDSLLTLAALTPMTDTLVSINASMSVLSLALEESFNNDFFLVDLSTFEDGAPEWSDVRLSVCGISKDVFLGGHCKYSYHTTSRTYVSIPPHTRLRVTGRTHFIGKWEGQSLTFKIDDVYVNSVSHHWCPGVFESRCRLLGIDECGSGDGDGLSQFWMIEIPHIKDQFVRRVVM
eukprot:Blabericola_migrator_1__13569@NODE_996_length_5754_cov_95_776508_g685_i0_p3_GENE_NODE_996_length_5754_cov_95_776508_g685_i0NODE_996_length_5754_cov_95_776508_g685_i0_p3_ORF_typecomplete_len217_score51_23_NODE_996_length_5754_cov_95_776508_g685_i023302980